HRFFKCERVGADVRRLDEDLRWRDVRVEADGQLAERHRPQEDHEDRDDDGDDGPVDEEPGHYARRGAPPPFRTSPRTAGLRGPSPRSERNVRPREDFILAGSGTLLVSIDLLRGSLSWGGRRCRGWVGGVGWGIGWHHRRRHLVARLHFLQPLDDD